MEWKQGDNSAHVSDDECMDVGVFEASCSHGFLFFFNGRNFSSKKMSLMR